uniref:Ulp1 protease family, C-terminal catalytic domain containing protein n=1 Tax=Solanum tuberosum TaxID=4113 RepID=M1DHS4_SOLTU
MVGYGMKMVEKDGDCGVFVAAYTEFFSDVQIPSDGIISQSLRLRYASLLYTNIIAPVKRKIVLKKETTDTKIQKRPRTRTCRKKNENSTTTLLEELASEAVSSSQVEAEFSQKEYEEREKEKNEVDDDG